MNRPRVKISPVPTSIAEGCNSYLYMIHVPKSEDGHPIIQLCPQRWNQYIY